MSLNHAPFALASAFDRYLGDPSMPDNAFSYARCAQLDAHERFPDAVCAMLSQWGCIAITCPSGSAACCAISSSRCN